MVKFVMCTLVSRDCVPFCKYVKRHMYPGNQGTLDKLNQIPHFYYICMKGPTQALNMF